VRLRTNKLAHVAYEGLTEVTTRSTGFVTLFWDEMSRCPEECIGSLILVVSLAHTSIIRVYIKAERSSETLEY
jgi:hypothetical protein